MSNPHSLTNRGTQATELGVPATSKPNPASSKSTIETSSPGKPKKKSFQELFSRDELGYYGIAAVVYIVLGVLVQDIVLNWIIGPLFIVAWMWWIPPLVEEWRSR